MMGWDFLPETEGRQELSALEVAETEQSPTQGSSKGFVGGGGEKQKRHLKERREASYWWGLFSQTSLQSAQITRGKDLGMLGNEQGDSLNLEGSKNPRRQGRRSIF